MFYLFNIQKDFVAEEIEKLSDLTRCRAEQEDVDHFACLLATEATGLDVGGHGDGDSAAVDDGGTGGVTQGDGRSVAKQF